MSWAAAELSETRLGDERRTRRLVRIVEDLAARPGAGAPWRERALSEPGRSRNARDV